MTSRQLPILSNDPEGVSGKDWTDQAADSLRHLYKFSGGPLTLAAASTANAIVAAVAIPQGFDGYTDGLVFQFIAGATNTGAMSIELGGLQAIPMRNRAGAVLGAGDVALGDLVLCWVQNQICHVELAPKSSVEINDTANKVKKIWTVDRSVAAQGSGTMVVFTNVEGEVGDVVELPPIIGLTNTDHPEHPPNSGEATAVQNAIYWNIVGVPVASGTNILKLFKDETEIAIVATVSRIAIQTGEQDTGSGTVPVYAYHAEVDHPVASGLARNLIELTDDQPHDYSLRQVVLDVSAGLAAHGLVKLLSIDGAFT